MSRTSRGAAKLAFCLAAAGALLVASCDALVWPFGSAGTGGVEITLGASLNGRSRTVTADFREAIDTVTVTAVGQYGAAPAPIVISDGDDGDFDGRISTATATLTGLAAGRWTITVIASQAGTECGRGQASVRLVANATVAATVPVVFAQEAAGDLELAVRWPEAVADDVSAVIDGAACAVTVPVLAGGFFTATLTRSGVPSGAYDMPIVFYRGPDAVARVSEAVNIWDDVTSRYWIDSDGAFAAVRDYTETELAAAGARLAGVQLTGLAGPIIFDPALPVYDLDTVAAEIGFMVTRDIPGQTITYAWNAWDAVTAASGDIDSDVAYGPLALSSLHPAGHGLNQLILTVTAPNGVTDNTYTFNLTKGFPVHFDLDSGIGDGGFPISPQLIAMGNAVLQPTDPTRPTGFTFAGWYADAARTDAWDFGVDTVTGETTLYAKWLGIATGGSVVTNPAYANLSFPAAVVAVGQGVPVTITTNDPTLAAVAAGWTWRLAGADLGVATPSLTLDAAATASLLGEYILSAEVVLNGIGYSGSILLSVTPPLSYTGTLSAGDLADLKASLTGAGDLINLDLSGAVLPALAPDTFFNCNRLASIILPPGVGALPDRFLANCQNLTYVSLPPGTTSLGMMCFFQCYSLTSITVPEGVVSMGERCFEGCSSLSEAVLPSTLTAVPNYCFTACSSLTSVTLAPGITSIGMLAFGSTTHLTTIDIPPTVGTINTYCFDRTGLTAIDIPDGVMTIGVGCFNGSNHLVCATLPTSLTSIPDMCFANCASLTDLYIRSTALMSVSPTAINNCGALQRVHVKPGMTAAFAAWQALYPTLVIVEDQ